MQNTRATQIRDPRVQSWMCASSQSWTALQDKLPRAERTDVCMQLAVCIDVLAEDTHVGTFGTPFRTGEAGSGALIVLLGCCSGLPACCCMIGGPGGSAGSL
jgi:hypothetical protein